MAYADFVTALMSLFIVLWLMGSSARVKQSVSGYFQDPRGYTTKLGAGPANAGEGLKINQKTVADIQKQLEQALRRAPESRHPARQSGRANLCRRATRPRRAVPKPRAGSRSRHARSC